MKILLTGSSGFLGRHALQTALENGHDVVGLDKKSSGFTHNKFQEVTGDITDQSLVMKITKGCNAVFHLAAALAQFEPDEYRMHRVNVIGTANSLAAAVIHKVNKFIYMSSVEVYGIDVPTPCPEDAPMNPICQYGRDKVDSEELCANYLAQGLDITIFRPPTINGPGQNEPFLVSQIEAISKGKSTILPGGGHSRLQMVDVRDVCSAMFLALDNPQSKGKVMNLASDNVPTLRQAAHAVYRHAGKKPKFINVNASLARTIVRILSILHISPLEPQHLEIALKDYVFDNARAKKILNWQPVKTDIESFIDAYDGYVQKHTM